MRSSDFRFTPLCTCKRKLNAALIAELNSTIHRLSGNESCEIAFEIVYASGKKFAFNPEKRVALNPQWRA